jgi:hypothetical protein
MTKIIFATLLAAFATVAQAVKLTNSDWNVVAGETFTIGWTDAEGGVSIRLKSGLANSLQTVQEIAGLFGHGFDKVTRAKHTLSHRWSIWRILHLDCSHQS